MLIIEIKEEGYLEFSSKFRFKKVMFFNPFIQEELKLKKKNLILNKIRNRHWFVFVFINEVLKTLNISIKTLRKYSSQVCSIEVKEILEN